MSGGCVSSRPPRYPRSEDDDAVRCGLPPVTERREDLTRIQWVGPAQRVPAERESAPVRPRIGDQDHDPIDPSVSLLAIDPSLQRLDVRDARLGFERRLGPDRPDHHVPGTQVARDRKGHLNAPWDRRREAPPESIEERHLGHIPNGIARRIRPNDQVQPDGGTRSGQDQDRDARKLGAFDPPDGRVGYAHGAGNRGLAQPRTQARSTDLLADRGERTPRKSGTSVSGSLAGRHLRRSSPTTLIPHVFGRDAGRRALGRPPDQPDRGAVARRGSHRSDDLGAWCVQTSDQRRVGGRPGVDPEFVPHRSDRRRSLFERATHGGGYSDRQSRLLERATHHPGSEITASAALSAGR